MHAISSSPTLAVLAALVAVGAFGFVLPSVPSHAQTVRAAHQFDRPWLD